jgi:hypothetical protein
MPGLMVFWRNSAGKPLSLFAKTAAKTPDAAEEESGFQDIKGNAESK